MLVSPSEASAYDPNGNRALSLLPYVGEIAQEPVNWTTPGKAAVHQPFVELGAIDSRQGEPKEDFLLRVAKVLDTFTGLTRHEACGALMQNQARDIWRVRLITNRSQVACVRIIFEEPGFTATTETIHSHPKPKRFEGVISIRANFMDQRVAGKVCGSYLKLDDEAYSKRDIENGPGYLVARGLLLHRQGPHSGVRIVGSVDPLAIADRLMIGGAKDHLYTQEGLHAATIAWSKEDIPGLPGLKCPAVK